MNLSTLIVLLIVAGVVAFAIGSIIRDKKSGKSCHCGVSGCAGCSGCHSGTDTKQPTAQK